MELSVLLVYRWLLARLRHQRFFSLEELNGAIRPLLTDLNNRPFQRLPGSRRSVFEALDRPAMRALPPTPYVFAEWKERTVAFDYHVDVDRHYYSVPHALVGHQRVGALHRRHGRGVLPQRAGRQSRALLPARRAHHLARAHAQVPPRARRVVAEAPDPVGKLDRHRTPAPSLSTCCAPNPIPSKDIEPASGF